MCSLLQRAASAAGTAGGIWTGLVGSEKNPSSVAPDASDVRTGDRVGFTVLETAKSKRHGRIKAEEAGGEDGKDTAGLFVKLAGKRHGMRSLYSNFRMFSVPKRNLMPAVGSRCLHCLLPQLPRPVLDKH